ncbi:hypothetical protein diail_350 [Diaporthe ilicicola]|nr:hypothetical protein diail_350 [Diaporthe ilicicola]
MSVYSRRSSSASSGRSTGSTITVKSSTLNVPRSKSLSVVTYLAGGDPRKHKNLRRQKTTTEYENGTYETSSQFFWVRDPYASTYYWDGDYDDFDDRSSVYSGSSGSSGGSSRRSKHGGMKSRGGPTAVPVQSMPPPPQQPMGMPHMGGMGMGGMPPHMPPHMGMGGPPPPPMMGGGGMPPHPHVMDEMDDDDDTSSSYSGSSYMSGSSYSSQSHGGMQPPPPMGMPHMQHPPMHMGHGPMGGGPPMMSGGAGGHMPPPPPRSHHGVDNGGGDDIPEFFTLG